MAPFLGVDYQFQFGVFAGHQTSVLVGLPQPNEANERIPAQARKAQAQSRSQCSNSYLTSTA